MKPDFKISKSHFCQECRSSVIIIISCFLLMLHLNSPFYNLHAQSNDLIFEEISIEQGLSQSIVFCIIQDQKGFMWFGTEDGLNKYDGYTFTVYRHDPNNPNSLSYNEIRTIYEDSSGIFWIGTFYGGLNKFNPEKALFIHYQYDPDDPNSLSHNNVKAVFEERSGVLWIGTESGLNKFNRKTGQFTRYRNDPNNPNSLSHNVIRAIYQDQSGLLWIATEGGLNKFDRETERFTVYHPEPGNPESLSDDMVTSIYQDRSGALWIGTHSGLNRLDQDRQVFTSFKNDPSDSGSLSHNEIRAIYQDRSGLLWIGTNGGGLNRFDKKTGNFIRYQNDPQNSNSLSHNQVYSIYEDRSGILWLGTYGGGTNKILKRRKQFIHYQPEANNPNSLPEEIVWSFYEDKDDILWLGTHGGGLTKFEREKNRYTHYQHDPNDPQSLSSNYVRVVYQAPGDTGALWIGTHGGGLNKFNLKTEKFTRYLHDPHQPTSLSHNEIRAIYEDRSGVLWIGTNGGGLNKFDQNTEEFTHYRADPQNPGSLSNDFVRMIYEDPDEARKVLWIATQGGGLNKFDRITKTFTPYRNDPDDPHSLNNDYIFSIHEDTAGIFWIGTWGGGLNRFDRQKATFKNYTINDGLPSNQIYGILEDEKGNLWISTNNGLSKFDIAREIFKNFTVEDGLQSREFNGGAYFKSRRGEMFFGGIRGFNSFFPENIKDNPHVPPIVITGFFKLNKEVKLEKPVSRLEELSLSYKDYVFSFEFAALDYTAPLKNKYAYQMEGLDEEWIYTDSRKRFATYTTLDPGHYVFKVKGSNNDGLWNEEGASIRLIIHPPFWESWWFRTLIILVVLFAAFAGYQSRIRKIENRRKELEIRVQERTEAAEALQNALSEVERLKNRLQAENIYLQDEIKLTNNFENIVTRSEALKKVLYSVEEVAATDATVLILGESGTGKELVARAIHNISDRGDRPLVKVNCAALPSNLIESELFGHEKGAFTGAISRKIGRFELADGGTIFLDEIGDLPLELQSKLLRVLQEGEFERLGSSQTIKVDVRIIAATNRALEKEVGKGSFREDLYYRLNVFPVILPPLRERKEDIPLLVNHFVKKYSARVGKKIEIITQHVLDILEQYHWPGNVRELENIIERAVIISPGKKLIMGDWLSKNESSSETPQIYSLEEMERRYILEVLEMTNWRVSGEKGAAKILGINSKTLDSRMKKLNIKRKK